MPPTGDLHARILAVIKQTETIAQITAGGGGLPDPVWTTEASRSQTWQILREVDDPTPIGYITDGRWEIRHIVRHDPAAVLRRCAADRRILELHPQVEAERAADGDYPTGCQTCHNDIDCGWTKGDGLCDTMIALAEGYGITVDDSVKAVS